MACLFDLRGLNYPFFTGVNTVTIHILYQIYQLQQAGKINTNEFKLYGLTKTRREELVNSFDWLKRFETEYKNTSLNYLQKRMRQFNTLVRFYLNLSEKHQDYNIFYQTQPKPIVKSKNTKFITTFHDLSSIKNLNQPNFKQRLQENFFTYQRLANQADQIVTCSYSTAYDLVRTLKISENKIKVIYQALPDWDSLTSAVEDEIKNNEISQVNSVSKFPYILALSAFEYRKNYHNLILAWHYLSKTRSSIFNNLNLVIAGNVVDSSYLKYLKNLISKLELRNILLLEDIGKNEKEKLLAGCEFLVYTSLYEGFGFPILEAQKYNKAVLTSNVSSMPEIAAKGGLWVNPLDPMQIAEGIYILSSDSVYRKTLESEASENLSRFSWLEYNQAIQDLIKI